MGKLIPNQNTWVGFGTVSASVSAPTAANLSAAKDLTPLLISLNASSSGNVVPTPTFDTKFETTIVGTSSATFTADFYRDDADGSTGDLAWKTLPRNTSGYFFISRFGGAGSNNLPIAADVIEVWPVIVVSRTMANMSNNTVMTFTMTASVPVEPNEAATVAA